MTETADPSGRRLPRLCSRLALHVVVLAVIIWLVVLAVSKAPGRASASIDPGIAMSDTRAVEAPLSARGGSSLSGYAALSVDVMPAIMPAYDVPAPVAPTGTLPLALDGNLFKLPSAADNHPQASAQRAYHLCGTEGRQRLRTSPSNLRWMLTR